MNSYFLPNFKNFRTKKISPYVILCIVDHTPCIFSLLLLRMRKLRPMQSCLVTNENEKENIYISFMKSSSDYLNDDVVLDVSLYWFFHHYIPLLFDSFSSLPSLLFSLILYLYLYILVTCRAWFELTHVCI